MITFFQLIPFFLADGMMVVAEDRRDHPENPESSLGAVARPSSPGAVETRNILSAFEAFRPTIYRCTARLAAAYGFY